MAEALKVSRDWNIHSVEQGWGEVEKAERTAAQFHSALPRHAQQQRHADQFFREAGRWMVSASVIQKLLTVVRRECQHAIVPESEATERLYQSRYLEIYPTNPSIVQRSYLVAVPL
jgi:hypothetical protein